MKFRGGCPIQVALALALLTGPLPGGSPGDAAGFEADTGGVAADGSGGGGFAADGPSEGERPVPAVDAGSAEEEAGGQQATLDAQPAPADPVSDREPTESSLVPESTLVSADAVPSAAASTPGEESLGASGCDRVRLRLDVVGEVFATAGTDAPPLRLPTRLEARFDFTESSAPGADGYRVERTYVDAAADLTVDGDQRRIALAADARVVRFAVLGTTPTPFLAAGHLTREELDLLETPFDPLLASAVGPQTPVTEHESWEIPADAAAGLLAIDTVESGGLQARLAGVVDGVATVAITGIIDGAADGVPTHVTVEGTCLVPATVGAAGGFRLDRPPRSAAVTIRERREAGHVSPGFDVEARVSFAREPALPDDGLGTEGREPTVRRGGPGRPGLVWHRDALGRYEIVHDCTWRTIEDGPEGLVMRLVDHGALVAQCSVTALPRGPVADPPRIADVERDLQRSLAGQVTGIEHSSEASRSDGVRIVRVVATGRAGDLPFRWVHAVLTDAAGHRVAVTCLHEGSLRERFGTADRDLVDGISLPGADGSGRHGAGGPLAREARLPPDSPQP